MAKTKTVEIQCTRCSGSGSVQLPFIHAQKLKVIRGYRKPGATIGQLAEDCGCNYTAMSQRLVRLESLGLITLDRMSGRNMLAVANE